MDKLTIEQKAQRYEEALKVLHKYDGANIMFSQSLKEEMFPELKESKGERIREEIISYIKSSGAVTNQEWIAWLEKQGEKQAVEQSPFTFDDVLALQCAMASAKESDKELYKALQSLHDRVHDIYHGEQKENEEPITPKVLFKKDDWVVNKFGDAWHIDSFDGKNYQVSNGDKHCYFPIEKQNVMHLWTIQDAKDGDVLHCWIDGDEFILIYKGVKDGYITTYGHLYQKLKLFSEEPTTMFCRTIQGHFTPATKEQRDLLFQKMHKDGYTFDFDKKELKKIEQKPAWSEEDERAIGIIKTALEHPYDMEGKWDRKFALDWLKSLKDRYTWKPSEEQIEAIRLARSFVTDDFIVHPTLSELLIELEKQLKKLKW